MASTSAPATEIYQLIRKLADSGVAVVVVSSEVEEVLGLADRVLVVREGEVVHEAAATELDESRVLDLVMEGKSRMTENVPAPASDETARVEAAAQETVREDNAVLALLAAAPAATPGWSSRCCIVCVVGRGHRRRPVQLDATTP